MAKSSKGTNQWDFLKDATIEAIRGGQLGLFGFFVTIGIILLRMPGEELSKLVFEILHAFASGALIGWIGFGVVLFFTYLLSRSQRRKFVDERVRMESQLDKYRELLSDDYIEIEKLPPAKKEPVRRPSRALPPASEPIRRPSRELRTEGTLNPARRTEI